MEFKVGEGLCLNVHAWISQRRQILGRADKDIYTYHDQRKGRNFRETVDILVKLCFSVKKTSTSALTVRFFLR